MAAGEKILKIKNVKNVIMKIFKVRGVKSTYIDLFIHST